MKVNEELDVIVWAQIVLPEGDAIQKHIYHLIVVMIEIAVHEEDQKYEDNHHQQDEIHVHPNRVAVAHPGMHRFFNYQMKKQINFDYDSYAEIQVLVVAHCQYYQ